MEQRKEKVLKGHEGGREGRIWNEVRALKPTQFTTFIRSSLVQTPFTYFHLRCASLNIQGLTDTFAPLLITSDAHFSSDAFLFLLSITFFFGFSSFSLSITFFFFIFLHLTVTSKSVHQYKVNNKESEAESENILRLYYSHEFRYNSLSYSFFYFFLLTFCFHIYSYFHSLNHAQIFYLELIPFVSFYTSFSPQLFVSFAFL